MGGSNSTHARSNCLICMHFIRMSMVWRPYHSSLYMTSKQSTPWELYWLVFITLNLFLSLSLPPLPTRYSDREHPQRQSTLWAISWSIPRPLASTPWRRVPTRSLVSFDNPGHGCPMAKSSLRCLTLPNKVGVVQGHRTVMYENACTYALLEMRYYSGTSIIQAPLVPSKVSWVKKCPYLGDFRYISGRRGNAYSCHWVLRTCIPKLSLLLYDGKKE